MNTRVIGIDLAVTAKHKAVILDSATNKFLGKQLAFRARPQEMDRLLARARAGAEGPLQLVAMLEATGMSWYPVGTYLHDRDVAVYRINGRQTRDLRQVLSKYASSDRIDARVLAQLYQLTAAELIRWVPPSGQQLALQRACREADRWRQLDVAIQNRLHSYDQWAWGGLKGLLPASARRWVYQHWYNPWRVCAAGEDALRRAWQEEAPEEEQEAPWMAGWVQRAQMVTRLYRTPERVGYQALQETVRRQLQLQQQSRETKARLSRELIQPLFRELYPDCPLQSLYGVGANSAATYMAFIHDIARFPTVAAFRLWCGMVPHSRQSGLGESKGTRLTQAGPNLVKATLYLNADVARLWDVQLAALYYRQMVAYGKHHTQAVCACASHLASRIYALLKQQRPYQLRDLEGQPISPERSRELCRTTYLVPEDVRRRNNARARKARRDRRSEQRFWQEQRL